MTRDSASDSTTDRVLETVAMVLGLERSELDAESGSESLSAWDSVNTLNIAVAIEAEFGVSLSPEDIAEMLSVPLILEILKERRGR
jgi:acyl carrier protein